MTGIGVIYRDMEDEVVRIEPHFIHFFGCLHGLQGQSLEVQIEAKDLGKKFVGKRDINN